MKNKHEQLYVAVQDLLIEIGITPEDLICLATKGHQIELYGEVITAKTAQKLIDADLIIEQINWRKPGNVFGPDQETNKVNAFQDKELSFNKIKSSLAPRILWEYLQEAHPDFLQEERNK